MSGEAGEAPATGEAIGDLQESRKKDEEASRLAPLEVCGISGP